MRQHWFLSFIFGIFLITGLGGCQSVSDEPPVKTAHPPSSTLQAGDKIRITVLGDEDLSGEYDIDTSGKIVMQLIGEIEAASLSPQDLQTSIAAKLSEGYIVSPDVSVEMISLRPFYILGEVENPGSYPSVPELDVFKAIATAGGLTPRARKNSYTIYRGVGAARQEISAVDSTPVLPGDSIRVKERFF